MRGHGEHHGSCGKFPLCHRQETLKKPRKPPRPEGTIAGMYDGDPELTSKNSSAVMDDDREGKETAKDYVLM